MLFNICNNIEIIKDEINLNLNNKIKIAHISDLQINKKKRIYKNTTRIINEINPDILIISGDAIDYNKQLNLLNEFLSDIDYSIKKYAVLGNHEYRHDLDFSLLKETYQKKNTKLLIDSGEIINIKGVDINIFGLDDICPNLENYSYIEGAVNIIIVHRPVFFDLITEKYKDKEIFVFSGHTHGGQITFFGKPYLLPSGCGSYLKGKYELNRSVLYVSKGIGTTSIDLRIKAKPDVIYIEMK